MMIVFGFLILLVGGLLVALLVGGSGALMGRERHSGASQRSEKASAREILNRRLARGEISHEEYKAIRDQVES